LFASAGQAQMATKAVTKPVTASSKTTIHKPAGSTATVTPTVAASKPATTTSSTAIRRKHHHKVTKAAAKKSK
jgi:hypothetical protein